MEQNTMNVQEGGGKVQLKNKKQNGISKGGNKKKKVKGQEKFKGVNKKNCEQQGMKKAIGRGSGGDLRGRGRGRGRGRVGVKGNKVQKGEAKGKFTGSFSKNVVEQQRKKTASGQQSRGGLSGQGRLSAQGNREGVLEGSTNKRRNPNKRKFTPGHTKMVLPPVLQQEMKGRIVDRDLKTVYVRFPPSLKVCTETEVRELVKEAKDIRLPRASRGKSVTHCFIEFKSEEEARQMKETIQAMEVDGQPFYTDYVGEKSKHYADNAAKAINPLTLYIGSLPRDVTRSGLREVFDTSVRVHYQKNKGNQSHAFVTYKTHEEALNVFNTSKDLLINGKEVSVMFAAAKGNSNKDETAAPTKKMKVSEARIKSGDEEDDDTTSQENVEKMEDD